MFSMFHTVSLTSSIHLSLPPLLSLRPLLLLSFSLSGTVTPRAKRYTGTAGEANTSQQLERLETNYKWGGKNKSEGEAGEYGPPPTSATVRGSGGRRACFDRGCGLRLWWGDTATSCPRNDSWA